MWLIVAAACASTVGVIAVVTGGFGLVNSKELAASDDRTAQDHCETEVLNRLASPTGARLWDVETVRSPLDPDSQDLFPLLGDALKGVDHSRITVWKVSGVVDTQNEFGAMIHDRFRCRAYFLDGHLADSLVVFDHDH